MFGNKVIRGLETSVLLHEKIHALQSEEDLRNLINEISEEDVTNKIVSAEGEIISNISKTEKMLKALFLSKKLHYVLEHMKTLKNA